MQNVGVAAADLRAFPSYPRYGLLYSNENLGYENGVSWYSSLAPFDFDI